MESKSNKNSGGRTNTASSSVIVHPSAHDFEPYCEWQREEALDTLIVHVPDFKKDELRVQVNNLGVVRITGDRALDHLNGIKRNRFYKETKLPPGCHVNKVQAKLSHGKLSITMPKKSHPTMHFETDPQRHSQSTDRINDFPRPHHEEEEEESSMKREHVDDCGDVNGKDDDEKVGFGKLKVGKKVAVRVGIAVAAMVAVGALAFFRCSSRSSDSRSGVSTAVALRNNDKCSKMFPGRTSSFRFP